MSEQTHKIRYTRARKECAVGLAGFMGLLTFALVFVVVNLLLNEGGYTVIALAVLVPPVAALTWLGAFFWLCRKEQCFIHVDVTRNRLAWPSCKFGFHFWNERPITELRSMVVDTWGEDKARRFYLYLDGEGEAFPKAKIRFNSMEEINVVRTALRQAKAILVPKPQAPPPKPGEIRLPDLEPFPKKKEMKGGITLGARPHELD